MTPPSMRSPVVRERDPMTCPPQIGPRVSDRIEQLAGLYCKPCANNWYSWGERGVSPERCRRGKPLVRLGRFTRLGVHMPPHPPCRTCDSRSRRRGERSPTVSGPLRDHLNASITYSAIALASASGTDFSSNFGIPGPGLRSSRAISTAVLTPFASRSFR